jgi:nucleotide-binding universal stress UspA family protein
MYDTILVPLDGSKRAEVILPHVEALALDMGARVIFLQVLEPMHTIVGPDRVYVGVHQQVLDQQRQEAETYLAALEGVFREKGIEARTRIGYGPVVEEITAIAKEEGADLIAIASHGRTGLSRVFYGSVAAGVLHRVDRPLLVIRSLGE